MENYLHRMAPFVMNKIFLLLPVSLAIVFICGCDNNTTSDKDILINVLKAQCWYVNMKNSSKQNSQGELILSIEKEIKYW